MFCLQAVLIANPNTDFQVCVSSYEGMVVFKDVHANCFCALLRTQIHTPLHAWARAK